MLKFLRNRELDDSPKLCCKLDGEYARKVKCKFMFPDEWDVYPADSLAYYRERLFRWDPKKPVDHCTHDLWIPVEAKWNTYTEYVNGRPKPKEKVIQKGKKRKVRPK